MYQYWGKAPDKDSLIYHPLVYHALDVAAVGQHLLQQQPQLCQTLANRLGLDTETFQRWHGFFLALHDLGKFSYRFQNLRPDLYHHLQQQSSQDNYTIRHDSLGYFIWQQQIADIAFEQDYFNLQIDHWDQDDWDDIFNPWMRSVTGHHGQPPKTIHSQLNTQFTPQNQDAIQQFISVCQTLLIGDHQPPANCDVNKLIKNINRISWWLAGLSTLSDWLGSQNDVFIAQSQQQDLPDYWQTACQRASQVVKKAKLQPPSINTPNLTSCFDYIKTPTPLQHCCQQLDLKNQAGIYIIEDVTGAGKTEAALHLAHRIMAQGQAEGLYLALPTMATSNALFKRIKQYFYPHVFKQETEHTNLILAHAASELALHQQTESDYDHEGKEQPAGSYASQWFSDSRKKALLADLGVGTIDQALLAILQSKHQSLRLMGLTRKILIVDEVHACDTYMLTLLKQLLSVQAFIGGSVILLSATLPQHISQQLISAYYNKLDYPCPQLNDKLAYPLLTQCQTDVLKSYPLATREQVKRSVSVQLNDNETDIIQHLINQHQQQHCACWIRNTVTDALSAYQQLQQHGIPLEKITLFHARYALGDRLDIENKVLSLFGKDSTAAQRQGQILIATQVVEQSLDIDFDFMVSDLAPIDLIIQRAGRLCRHNRDQHGNLITKTDQRGTPHMLIYSPKPTPNPDKDWYKTHFPKAAYVYPEHGKLWLTACLLQAKQAIRMPEDARDFIEHVYDPQAPIPETLERLEVESKQMAQRDQGNSNSITLEKSYQDSGIDLWDDALTPTRLSEQVTHNIRLARYQNGKLSPWYQQEQDNQKFAWQLSQLSVSDSILHDSIPPSNPELKTAIATYQQQVFDKGKWTKLLVLESQDNRLIVQAEDKDHQTVTLEYDVVLGFRRTET